MNLHNTIDELLDKACSSIKYRIRRDILNELIDTQSDSDYQQIKKDPQLQYALSLQKRNGYLGDVFHSGFMPNGKFKGKTGFEGIMRYLIEKGLDSNDLTIKRAIKSLNQNNWLGQAKGIWCTYYEKIGMYGPDFIRMVIKAIANSTNENELEPYVDETITAFKRLESVASLNEITEPFRYGGKQYKVYRKGVIFPESYHLCLLAYTDLWHNKYKQAVTAGIEKLIHLSPLTDIKVKHKSRWLAPAGIQPLKLDIDLSELATNGWQKDNWAQWFHTFELFARMNVVKNIPELKKQADQLLSILDSGNGFFKLKLPTDYFNRWSIYHGLALELDWKNGRGIFDLTFRALLILHLAGLLD